MIKDRYELEKLERELIRAERADLFKNLSLVEAMYEEAVLLGAFPLKDPLEGLETDIRVAKVVNSVSKTPGTHS